VWNAIALRIYRHLPVDPEQRFRAQLMLGVVSALIFADFLVLLFFIFGAQAHMDESTRRISITVMTVGETLHLFSLFALLRGYLRFAAASIVVVATVAIWLSVFFTGGIPMSPALPLLLAPVVLTFCLAGPRPGLLVALATTLVMGIQWYGVLSFGWVMPALQSRKNPPMDALLIAVTNSLIVILVLLAYERITAHLRKLREEDRQRLAVLASLDDLTGVGNRRTFESRLHEACARCDRSGDQLAVFYIDLNDFKQINDELGHQAGDQVLRMVAERLRSTLRLNDTVARLGGDEFAVIVEPIQSQESIDVMHGKLRDAITDPLVFAGLVLTISASIGHALYPAQGVQPDDLLRLADADMYREKYDHDMQLAHSAQL
jgi:diguanylate cyclase (GGDEF)-like protein